MRKNNRSTVICLVLLSLLLLASLPAELLFNARPLLVVSNGKWYAPFLRNYAFRDFGGTSPLPVDDYRVLLDNARPLDTSARVDLFNEGAQFAPARQVPKLRLSPSFVLWAPVRHGYDSSDPTLATPPLTPPQNAWRDGHWLGTDEQGKDVLARLVYGFRISILFGLGLAITGTIVGVLIGAIQGFFGGWIDLVGQRLTEIWGARVGSEES